MRVLIASAWDPTSGVLSVYRSLARHLSGSGVRFSAFAFDGWREDTWWTFCDELIDGRTVTLADVLRSGRYDILHCVDTTYSPPYGIETWVRRARFRGPVVLMAQVARRELTEPAHATRYVACSSDAAKVLAADADGPVQVIPNGYDERVFDRRPAPSPGRPLLVWVGRSYDPQKDVDLFLDAVEALPQYDAVLVDADAEAAIVQGRLQRLGSRARHMALLQPEQMAEIYRAAAGSGGAFVCTSRYEGFLIAATEAMACDCPVVVPRIPGLDHLVDGANALVFERAAGVRGIVEALDRLGDPRFRAELVERARLEAEERWTSRTMADAYLRLYVDALAETASIRRSTFRDATWRTAWRAALAVRPAWHRVRRSARR